MVSSEAIALLRRLANGNAYLFGSRFDDGPLSLIEPAAHTPGIDRSLAEELVIAGYLEDEAQRGESTNVAFRIAEKGRSFLATMHP